MLVRRGLRRGGSSGSAGLGLGAAGGGSADLADGAESMPGGRDRVHHERREREEHHHDHVHHDGHRERDRRERALGVHLGDDGDGGRRRARDGEAGDDDTDRVDLGGWPARRQREPRGGKEEAREDETVGHAHKAAQKREDGAKRALQLGEQELEPAEKPVGLASSLTMSASCVVSTADRVRKCGPQMMPPRMWPVISGKRSVFLRASAIEAAAARGR